MEIINVKGMMCGGCERRVENAIHNLGITTVKADHNKGTVELELGNVSIEKIKETIENLGFELQNS